MKLNLAIVLLVAILAILVRIDGQLDRSLCMTDTECEAAYGEAE